MHEVSGDELHTTHITCHTYACMPRAPLSAHRMHAWCLAEAECVCAGCVCAPRFIVRRRVCVCTMCTRSMCTAVCVRMHAGVGTGVLRVLRCVPHSCQPFHRIPLHHTRAPITRRHDFNASAHCRARTHNVYVRCVHDSLYLH